MKQLTWPHRRLYDTFWQTVNAVSATAGPKEIPIPLWNNKLRTHSSEAEYTLLWDWGRDLMRLPHCQTVPLKHCTQTRLVWIKMTESSAKILVFWRVVTKGFAPSSTNHKWQLTILHLNFFYLYTSMHWFTLSWTHLRLTKYNRKLTQGVWKDWKCMRQLYRGKNLQVDLFRKHLMDRTQHVKYICAWS